MVNINKIFGINVFSEKCYYMFKYLKNYYKNNKTQIKLQREATIQWKAKEATHKFN